MTSRRQREQLTTQILETERMVDRVKDHPVMSFSLKQRLDKLKQLITEIPLDNIEPSVALFFSGGPVLGSLGIDTEFLGKALLPFQKMVRADLAQRSHKTMGARGQVKNANDAKLYLTALPRGSFGVELKKLENNNLFDELQLSESLNHVVRLVEASAKSDEEFASSLDNISQRTITGLGEFLQVLHNERASVTIESGSARTTLSVEDVNGAYSRVASASAKQDEVEVQGKLRGILLESWKFDFVTQEQKIIGAISNELTEDEVSLLNATYFNKDCIAVFDKTTVTLRNGRIKDSYVLKDIRDIGE